MERKKDKIEEKKSDRKLWWRNTGGTFYMRGENGETKKIIKPNQRFRATPEQIPMAFRDRIKPESDIPDSPIAELTHGSYRMKQRGDSDLFDIYDGKGKKVNEESLSEADAKELLTKVDGVVMSMWSAPQVWKNGECWLIGGGPSITSQFNIPQEIVNSVLAGKSSSVAYSPFLAAIHNKHVIAVNNAYLFGDWIDAMYFGDCQWHDQHAESLAKFPGIKVTSCPRFQNKPLESCGIRYLARDTVHGFGISSDPTTVSWNQNSGAAAISLARHFGVKRIVLLGFDMSLGPNRRSHWHGGHGTMKNKQWHPPFPRHLHGFTYIADDAKAMGIEIINACPTSAIAQFQKVSVAELLQEQINESSNSAGVQ